MIKVTVDIFSGLPNPSWIISGDRAVEIMKTVSTRSEAVADLDAGFQGLGYRGIILEPISDYSDREHDFPAAVRIGSGVAADEPASMELAARVLDTAPTDETEAIVPLDKDLKKLIQQGITEVSDALKRTTVDLGYDTESDSGDIVAPADVTCQIERGRFNPDFWNLDTQVRQSNNCYNYATNRKTNTFAQPGQASGRWPNPTTCDGVTGGALSDGAHHRFECFPETEKPRYLIALVIRPGQDYHWYRKHREGFWGHKPGHTPAKNTDNSGRIITDPSTCDRGPYTDFCGYFYTCKSMKVR